MHFIQKKNQFQYNPIYATYRASSLCGNYSLKETVIERNEKKKITLLANWKCYVKKKTAYRLIDMLTELKFSDRIDLIVCPNLLYIPYLQKKIHKNSSKIKICCQDISVVSGLGPFTGETTANIFSDFADSTTKKYALIGHSERKRGFLNNPETNEQTAVKVSNALHANLDVVLCIGNDFENDTVDFTSPQMENLLSLIKSRINQNQWRRIMFAFEPNFAVGTGISASHEILNGCCSFVKKWLDKEISQHISNDSIVLYGGSVNKLNIKEYLQNTQVDGFLIGKASVKESFVDIINTCSECYP